MKIDTSSKTETFSPSKYDLQVATIHKHLLNE